MLEITRLDGPFGIRVDGCDLAAISDADMKALAQALFDNRIAVIPGQALTHEQYIADQTERTITLVDGRVQ